MCSTCIWSKHNHACLKVIFNQQTKVTWSEAPGSILGLFCYSEDLDWGIRIGFKKKRKKEHYEWRVMQLLFLCYQFNFFKGFTFTTTRFSLQLSQRMLTFHARGKLRMTNFVVCRCRFTNNFFCKIAARGPLIYWWYHWKIFAVNFYVSCFDSRGNSIGEKLIRLYWENTVYRLLFALANTLTPESQKNQLAMSEHSQKL